MLRMAVAWLSEIQRSDYAADSDTSSGSSICSR